MPKLFRFAPIGALLSLLLLVTAHSSSAATYTVGNANDSGPDSLRQRILDANVNPGADTINFEIPTNDCIIILVSQLPAIDGELTIDGSGNCGSFTISGGLSVRVMLVNSGATLQITNLAITNGSAPFGGGISNSGTLTLNNSTLSGNSATTGNGGGISNSGTLTINGTTLSGNFAVRGGGIHNSGTLSLNVSAVSDNEATGGGGISTFGGTLTLTNSIVNGNTAVSGGGIYNNGGIATLTNSIVSNNLASEVGGIRNTGAMTLDYSTVSSNAATGVGGIAGIENFTGTMSVNNSTVSSNNSDGAFGGIYNEFAALSLTNSTISNNSGAYVGGIASFNFVNFGLSLTLTNSTVSDNTVTGPSGVGGIFNIEGPANVAHSIIAGNTAALSTPDAAGVFLSQGYNLVGDGGVSTGFVAPGDQVGTTPAPLDPMLGPLQDNGGPTLTHAFLAGSPAIDAGDPAYAGALTTDQRGAGFDRISNNRIDIGAFELQSPPVCPLPQGDWKNNPVWPVDSLTLGDETYTNGELLDILNTPVGRGRNADASIILAYQLIAAKLNIANGTDGASATSTIAEADALLGGFAGRLPYGVSPSSPTGKLMTGYGKTLDIFNNGSTTTGCSL